MKKMIILGLLTSALLAPISHATQNPQANSANTATQTNNAQPATASTEQTSTTPAPQSIPANPHDPANGTILDTQKPDDNALSAANTELLAKNAELSRQVESLTTQVNVLVQERSGQLFIYGGITALIGLVLGFILAKVSSRQRW